MTNVIAKGFGELSRDVSISWSVSCLCVFFLLFSLSVRWSYARSRRKRHAFAQVRVTEVFCSCFFKTSHDVAHHRLVHNTLVREIGIRARRRYHPRLNCRNVTIPLYPARSSYGTLGCADVCENGHAGATFGCILVVNGSSVNVHSSQHLFARVPNHAAIS